MKQTALNVKEFKREVKTFSGQEPVRCLSALVNSSNPIVKSRPYMIFKVLYIYINISDCAACNHATLSPGHPAGSWTLLALHRNSAALNIERLLREEPELSRAGGAGRQ